MTPETELKKSIKQYLTLKKIFWWYNLAGIGSHKGIPDLFALSEGKLYGIEVKAPRGKISEHQQQFQMELKNNGAIPITAYCLEDVMMFLP